jgi:triosephosphate isomerase
MRRLIFAGNWKMHLGPAGARTFLRAFLPEYQPAADREVWFFAPAVSVATVAGEVEGTAGLRVGIQHVHWEPKGAFTGETSVAMAVEAGATAALVGHSERRQLFGETDRETALKVRAALAGGLIPMLCVGETLAERERDETLAVVERQLRALDGLTRGQLARVHVAYEPVWAIGTGKNATPADAALVHHAIRTRLQRLGAPSRETPILYGGSVKPDNVSALIAEEEIDGVLVGGASIDPTSWAAIVRAARD